jgi:cell division protein FtsQ
MAWRRRKDAETTPVPADDASSSLDPLVPDEAVLDELSRAFGNGASDEATDGTTVAASGTTSGNVTIAGPVEGSGNVTIVGPVDRSSSDSDLPPVDSSGPASRGTISIIGDDLPDAAYLDDELESDGSGSSPVFIDDDGSSDAVMPKDASTRGIEPRIRQRRIGVKRAENRRRLWWLVLAGAVLVVAIGVLALLGSSLFAVDQVTVTGNVYTDQEALDAVVDDLTGTPVLLVDTVEVEAEIESIPWVEDARVRTSFPDSASIEIRERTPVAAMLGTDGLARVIDVDGRVLGLVDGQPVALVWISGPGTLDVAPGQFASIGYSSAASLVTKLTPEIRSRVESMLVTPDGSDLVLILTSDAGPIEVRFGSAVGENAQIEKLVRLQRTLDDVETTPVTVIDVSTSEVTVR